MKKILILVIFCISFNANSQLTVTGLPIGHANWGGVNPNQVYNLTTNPVNPMGPYFGNDAGTNIYEAVDSNGGSYYIIRMAGKWSLVANLPTDCCSKVALLLYVNHLSSFSTSPSCIGNWERYTGAYFSDPFYTDVPFSGLNSFYTINFQNSIGSCLDCQIQSPVINPKAIDLPIIDEVTRNGLTSAEGLRKGAIIWNCETEKVNVWDGCSWKTVKTVSAFKTIMSYAIVKTNPDNTQLLNFGYFTNVPTAQIQNFKIQYSQNNAPWVTHLTLPASQTSYFANNLPMALSGSKYKFRVVTITTCGEEVPSCTIAATIYNLAPQPKFSLTLSDFDLGTAIRYTILPGTLSSVSNLGIFVAKFDPVTNTYINGYQLNLSGTTTLPYTNVIPSSELELNQTYRVNVFSLPANHYSFEDFVYQRIEPTCPEN